MTDNDAAEAVAGHLRMWADEEPEQASLDAMYESRFWESYSIEDGTWGLRAGPAEDESIDVHIETPYVWSFVNTYTSHLFLRAPTVSARLPGVLPAKAGRPKDLRELPQRVEAVARTWLHRADVQQLVTHAYQLALMGGAAAFKVGLVPGQGDALSRVWLAVCPRWECVWDDRARDESQQLYRGHLTYMLDYKAEEMLGSLPDKWERSKLPGRYVGSNTEATDTSRDGHRLERYVRVLELYDFEEEKQKFYLVSNDEQNPQVVRIGKAEAMPYRWPDGRPACPIFPIVLDNAPKQPMRGIPAVRRIATMAKEDNLFLSTYGSAWRQRAAIKGLVDEAATKKKELTEWWRSRRNLELIGVPRAQLDSIRFVEIPPMDSTGPEFKALLDKARSESEGFSSQMKGEQGDYLSAREAELVSEGGEATSRQISSRMVKALARATELVLSVVADSGETLRVLAGDDWTTLKAEQLGLPWQVTIDDAGTTPSREEGRKRDWAVALPMLEKLVGLVAPPADPVTGQILPVPKTLQNFAWAGLKYIQQTYALPSYLGPEALLVTEDAMGKEGVEPPVPEMDPLAAGAMPPLDPAMAAGGMPPVGPSPMGMGPPMDPSMGVPPMDVGGPPPIPPTVVQDPVTGRWFDSVTQGEYIPETGQIIPLPPMGGGEALA